MAKIYALLIVFVGCFGALSAQLTEPYSYEIKKVEDEWVSYGYYMGFFVATTVRGKHYGQQGIFSYKGKVIVSSNEYVNAMIENVPYIMNKYPTGMVIYSGKSNQVIFTPE